MANVRLFPPETGGSVTALANGRSYTCAANATLLLPDFDAGVLESNGWTKASIASGTTAQRPATPVKGQAYHDDTLGLTIFCTGFTSAGAAIWRRADTGAKA